MFPADFFDGYSARARPVLVKVVDDGLVFDLDGKSFSYRLADVEVQAKLGKSKRLIDLSDGGRLEALDIGELEAAVTSKTNVFWRTVHYFENHLGWVLVSLMATVFVGWMFLQFGVPLLAEHVANATPPNIEAKLGDEVLKGLDTKLGYFSPSKIEKSRQDSIKNALTRMCVAFKNCPQYRLEFRDSSVIGANAFALPGGVMVITDDLIRLSKNDTEIVAVLAHELGHVKKRHAFRQSIQGALSGLVLAAATGDVSSIASGLPGVLMQMRYTRELEIEADTFALGALEKACLPPKAFADILLRLGKNERNANPQSSKKSNSEDVQAGDPVSDMLSSHPDTLSRIKPFLEAKPSCVE
jgi:Zn-dependent protease with chaperone function